MDVYVIFVERFVYKCYIYMKNKWFIISKLIFFNIKMFLFRDMKIKMNKFVCFNKYVFEFVVVFIKGIGVLCYFYKIYLRLFFDFFLFLGDGE